ncbi:MAG: hypothetical protein AAF050_17160 [Cyanobacteria bacterium J06649_5]
MSEHQLSRKGDDPSDLYEIYLKGHLNTKWTDWFDGLTISLEDNGYTRLTGHIVDQSALHGLLAKIRDLGLPLISLMRVSSHQKTEEQKTEEQKIEETETTDHEHLPHDT